MLKIISFVFLCSILGYCLLRNVTHFTLYYSILLVCLNIQKRKFINQYKTWCKIGFRDYILSYTSSQPNLVFSFLSLTGFSPLYQTGPSSSCKTRKRTDDYFPYNTNVIFEECINMEQNKRKLNLSIKREQEIWIVFIPLKRHTFRNGYNRTLKI